MQEADKLVEKVEVVLKRPIPYATGGETVNATMVMLYAPSSVLLENSTFLKQSFFQAVASIKGDAKKDEDEKKDIKKLKGSDILMMMHMSEVDMVKVMRSAKHLLQSGVAKLDDKEKMNPTLLEALCEEDFDALVGEYLVNFTLASALRMIDSLK